MCILGLAFITPQNELSAKSKITSARNVKSIHFCQINAINATRKTCFVIRKYFKGLGRYEPSQMLEQLPMGIRHVISHRLKATATTQISYEKDPVTETAVSLIHVQIFAYRRLDCTSSASDRQNALRSVSGINSRLDWDQPTGCVLGLDKKRAGRTR